MPIRTHLIPYAHVKSIVNMEVLMVIIVEYRIGLPWLPPMSLKCNARMIDDAMIINV